MIKEKIFDVFMIVKKLLGIDLKFIEEWWNVSQ